MSGPTVGIFGGSFNPVHIAHLVHADEALDRLGLDRLLFVPARVPPHKDAADLLDGKERAELLRIALAGEPRFELSRIDLDRPGPSYTVDTIRLVRDALPAGSTLYYLLGSDSVLDLPGWKSPGEILELARLAVFPRPGRDLGAADPGVLRDAVVLDGPMLDVSSATIRARVRAGRPYRFLLPDGVWRRIASRGLYRSGG